MAVDRKYIRTKFLDDVLLPDIQYFVGFSNAGLVTNNEDIDTKNELFRLVPDSVTLEGDIITIVYTLPSDITFPFSEAVTGSDDSVEIEDASDFTENDWIIINLSQPHKTQITDVTGDILTISPPIPNGVDVIAGTLVKVLNNQVAIVGDGLTEGTEATTTPNTGMIIACANLEFYRDTSYLPVTQTVYFQGVGI